jgi:hypothetical protein
MNERDWRERYRFIEKYIELSTSQVLKFMDPSLGLIRLLRGSLDRFQDLVCVGDLDQSLDQEPVGYLRADIAILPGAISF